jgi:hypothetical protein
VRFNQTAGQRVAAAPFYDELVPVSAKTTLDAVTHALMTTPMTDRAGASIGDALGLIERLDSVRGEVTGTSSDRQFRIYVRLVADAIDRLERSTQFQRGVDNAIYHKGYPINYRAQGGVPSLQFSIAADRRHADIDVDYRSPSFPADYVLLDRAAVIVGQAGSELQLRPPGGGILGRSGPCGKRTQPIPFGSTCDSCPY